MKRIIALNSFLKIFFKTVVLFCLLIIQIKLIAQNNTQKYWYYRDRLYNGFVKVGNNNGESLISGIRNYFGGNNFINSKILHFGDQTIYMGWYFSVLATEYALLKQKGLSTEKTLTELYYAIEALKRLDAQSDLSWGNLSNGIDGFFIRDDVHNNFLSYNNNVVHYNLMNDNFNYKDIDTIFSDFSNSNQQIKEMSQDKVYALIMVFAIIKKFLENENKNCYIK